METIKLHQNEIEYLINSIETSKHLGNNRMLAERIINKLQKVKKLDTTRVSKSVCDNCKDKRPCKKHGVYGAACIHLDVKQTVC